MNSGTVCVARTKKIFSRAEPLGTFEEVTEKSGVGLLDSTDLDQGATSLKKRVIAANPQDPEAYYNLATLYLRKGSLQEARQYLKQAFRSRPSYPEAWNNLGSQRSKVKRETPSTTSRNRSACALLTLSFSRISATSCRRQGSFDEAEKLLRRALEITPDDPEVNYSLGMLFAHQERLDQAEQFLQPALSLHPDYPDALNNLGVLYVRERRNSEAEEKLQSCIRIAPDFDQP